jgi:hypothetical protein
MQVGKNLWDFLHRYSKRRAYTDTWLWVDAICIDQAILRERNHQVSLMRRIYSRARAVITWLGEPAGDDKIAHGTKLDVDERDSTKLCDAIDKLLKGQYWSRVWIVQEFVLPRTVHIWYGSFTCGGDDFDQPWPTSVLTKLRSHQNAYTVLLHRKMWLTRAALSGRAGVDTFQVCELIRAFSFAQATETLDQIYGFLGLASAAAKSNTYIKADYSKTKADVLLNVLRFERDTGIKQTQLLADYYYLRKLLKVSTFHLGRVVRDDPRRLQSHMYAMLGSSSVTAPLHWVSDVVAIQTSNDRRERLKSEFSKGERRRLRAMWRIRKLKRHSDYRNELGISRRNRARMHLNRRRRALLKQRGKPLVEEPERCSWRFKSGWPERERDQHMIDHSIEHMFKELLRTPAKHPPAEPQSRASPCKKAVDFRSTFSQSFDRNLWSSASKTTESAQDQDYLGSGSDYTAFMGTCGLRGIIIAEPSTTYQLWKHGGYGGPGIIQIWRFGGINNRNSGLVVRKFQTKSSLVSYTPIGFAFFANPDTVAPGLDDLSWPVPSKPPSFFEDSTQADSISEDSESAASELDESDFDGSELGGSDLDDSDSEELDEDSSDPFEDDEVNPLLATPGSCDPSCDTVRSGIHVRLDLPAMLELQRCGALSQDQVKHIGERWLMEADAVQTEAREFDMDLTRR